MVPDPDESDRHAHAGRGARAGDLQRKSAAATYLFSLMFFLGWIGGWGVEVARAAGQLPLALVPTIALAVYAALAYLKQTGTPVPIASMEQPRRSRGHEATSPTAARPSVPTARTLTIAQLGGLPIGLPFAAVMVAIIAVQTLHARPRYRTPLESVIVLLAALICALPPAYALGSVLWLHRAHRRQRLERRSTIDAPGEPRRHAAPAGPPVPAARFALYVFAALFALGASAGLTLGAVHRLGWTALAIVPIPVAAALFAIRSYGNVAAALLRSATLPGPSGPPSP